MTATLSIFTYSMAAEIRQYAGNDTERSIHGETDRQTDRHTDTQTDRRTDRQTNRQTHRHTDR